LKIKVQPSLKINSRRHKRWIKSSLIFIYVFQWFQPLINRGGQDNLHNINHMTSSSKKVSMWKESSSEFNCALQSISFQPRFEKSSERVLSDVLVTKCWPLCSACQSQMHQTPKEDGFALTTVLLLTIFLCANTSLSGFKNVP